MNSGNRFAVLVALSAAVVAAPATAQERTRKLDVRTAVKLAFRDSPGLRASQIDIKSAQQDIYLQEGRYPYVFEADAGYSRTARPNLGPNDTVTSSTTHTITAGTSLKRTFPTGTMAEVRAEGDRTDVSGGGVGFAGSGVSSTSYGALLRAQVTQPLMRGAGTEVGEAELRAARVGKAAAEKSLTRARSELTRDVLIAYWELWYANRAVQIERAALKLAEQQEADAKARLEQGALSAVDLLSFQTRTAQLEEGVVSAELERRRRSLNLSQTIGNLNGDPESIVASSAPPLPGTSANRAEIQRSIATGSVELAELEQNVRLARTRAIVAGDDARPRLDLSGYVESAGVSERFPKAWERAGSVQWWSTGVNLTFELPLDNTRRDAERARANLAVSGAEVQLRAARDRIAAEAATTVASDSAARRRLSFAERTLSLAERAHAAEKQRFELGQGLPIQVQQAEDGVRQARLRVARARIDVVEAEIARLHLTGQLVGRYGPTAG